MKVSISALAAIGPVAERVGFEPTIRFPVWPFFRRLV
jgi:hypothetical protein